MDGQREAGLMQLSHAAVQERDKLDFERDSGGGTIEMDFSHHSAQI